MNYDEFAFFNQQLATMLREGIALEGALKQLAAGMKSGPLRAELQQMEADLAAGTPLAEALQRRSLPPLYRQMLTIGARSNDLPGVLSLLADHYHQVNGLWTRLKGLMVYPVIVMAVSLGLTVLLSVALGRFLSAFSSDHHMPSTVYTASLWVTPVFFILALMAVIAVLALPGLRARLRWKLPAFREASLAQLASAMALMLKKGVPLPDALALAEALESGSPAGPALARWRALVEAGQGKPVQWPPELRPFPPLFFWLVRAGGEDLPAGFQKAAELYHARAAYRIELALYGALPVSVLFLGQMVVVQMAPLLGAMSSIMRSLGGTADF
jgi:type II secretory pathway component PulF